MKRYRNAKGQLTISLEEIKKKTIVEASDYYKPGSIYLNAADGQRICLFASGSGRWRTGTLPELRRLQLICSDR